MDAAEGVRMGNRVCPANRRTAQDMGGDPGGNSTHADADLTSSPYFSRIPTMHVEFREQVVTTFLGKIEREKARLELAKQRVDPWRLRLERVRGKIGDDGIERIATQIPFDYLEVLQRSRGAGACRRLARVMRDLGWTPVRVRDFARGGYKEQVRGYCRDARG
jgi:hypothetical protein